MGQLNCVAQSSSSAGLNRGSTPSVLFGDMSVVDVGPGLGARSSQASSFGMGVDYIVHHLQQGSRGCTDGGYERVDLQKVGNAAGFLRCKRVIERDIAKLQDPSHRFHQYLSAARETLPSHSSNEVVTYATTLLAQDQKFRRLHVLKVEPGAVREVAAQWLYWRLGISGQKATLVDHKGTLAMDGTFIDGFEDFEHQFGGGALNRPRSVVVRDGRVVPLAPEAYGIPLVAALLFDWDFFHHSGHNCGFVVRDEVAFPVKIDPGKALNQEAPSALFSATAADQLKVHSRIDHLKDSKMHSWLFRPLLNFAPQYRGYRNHRVLLDASLSEKLKPLWAIADPASWEAIMVFLDRLAQELLALGNQEAGVQPKYERASFDVMAMKEMLNTRRTCLLEQLGMWVTQEGKPRFDAAELDTLDVLEKAMSTTYHQRRGRDLSLLAVSGARYTFNITEREGRTLLDIPIGPESRRLTAFLDDCWRSPIEDVKAVDCYAHQEDLLVITKEQLQVIAGRWTTQDNKASVAVAGDVALRQFNERQSKLTGTKQCFSCFG